MKRKFLTGALTLLVVALAVAGALLFWQSRKLDDYTAQLSLGDKYLEELDYENAEIAYKKAIEIDEKRASAYVNLSVVYVKQNRFAEARELLAEAEEKVSGEQALQAVQEQLSRVEQQEERYQQETQAESTPAPTSSPTPEDQESSRIKTGVYVSQDNPEDTLTIEEVRENQAVVFTVFWHRRAAMSQAEAGLSGNTGTFSYYEQGAKMAAGTLEFQENDTIVLNLEQSALPNVEPGSTTYVMPTPEEEAAQKAAQAEEIRQWLTQGSGQWYKDDVLEEPEAVNFQFQEDGTAVYWPKQKEYVNTTSYTLDGEQITITFLALDTLEPVPLTYQVSCFTVGENYRIRLDFVSTEADVSQLYGFAELVPGWYTLA